MKRILVPVDLSPHSIAAARLAAGIARAHHARITLYHACEPLGDVEVPADTAEQMQRDTAAQYRHELGQLAESLELDAVEIVVEHEDPVLGILAAAADRDADLLALGCWGAGGGEAYRFGSVTASVARDARCPVLVTRADQIDHFPEDGRFTHPLVAIDYSRFSLPAVRVAAKLAPSAPIELIHIMKRPPGDPRDPDRAEQIGRLRAREMERLQAFSAAVDVAPVTVALRSDVGRVAGQILDYAAHSPTDLLVVGAHGREHDVELIGTSADRLLRASPVPIVVIPGRATSS